jgi:hypothetical protein
MAYLTKELTKGFIRDKKWTTIIRLMKEGAIDMPLKFKYETFLSLKYVCLRENKKEDSPYRYIPSYSNGNVTITKIRRIADGESCE